MKTSSKQFSFSQGLHPAIPIAILVLSVPLVWGLGFLAWVCCEESSYYLWLVEGFAIPLVFLLCLYSTLFLRAQIRSKYSIRLRLTVFTYAVLAWIVFYVFPRFVYTVSIDYPKLVGILLVPVAYALSGNKRLQRYFDK